MATFGDLKAYVEADGRTQEQSLVRQRRRTGDHLRYAKRLQDGSLLRTRVSHSLRDEIGPDLFRHILRDQLDVDEAAFWAVVRGRGPKATPDQHPVSIPAWLVQRLLITVGLAEEDVARMTPEDAQAAWDEYRTLDQG